ncbi:MAG TPA: NAD-dependent epimerase/dehydratase family protein [Methanocorpusculum sp.]|nr:NAD-dependent epimerase/dehydratase family protein [Methanocorpusculum sp.]
MEGLHPIISDDIRRVVRDDKINWEKLSGKTVLITGASGLIGSYLVFTLLCLNDERNLGIKITGLVRNRSKAEQRFGKILEREDFTLQVQDVICPLPKELKADFIIHAASQASPKYFISDPVGTISANTAGTQNLLEYARTHSISGFLYLSSREIYGEPVFDTEFISENEYGVVNPVLVRSCYPESKRLAETMCSCYASQYHIPAKIVRLTHVYGSDLNINNGRVWGDFLTNVAHGEDIVLKSDGKMRFAFTYVSDAVSGIMYVLLNGNDFVYNVGSKEILSIRELAEICTQLRPEKNIKIRYNISEDDQGYLKNRVAFLDCSAAEKLGWSAVVPVKEGFSRVLASLK